MRVLRSLLRVLAGFILACVVAALVSSLFIDTPADLARMPTGEFAEKSAGGLEHVLLVATHYAIFSAAFALIVAGLAEWLSLRKAAYAIGAGMLIALLGFTAQYWSEFADQPTIFNNYALSTFLASGFFAGLAYWTVAGRYAGLELQPVSGEAVAAGVKAGDGEPRTRVVVDKASGEVRAPGEVKKGSLAEKLAQKKAAVASAAKAMTTTAVPVTKPATGAAPAPDSRSAVAAAREPAKEAERKSAPVAQAAPAGQSQVPPQAPRPAAPVPAAAAQSPAGPNAEPKKS